MVMDKRSEQLQQLADIRAMMERSSRFISLSGLSGIAAGIIALIGVAVIYLYLGVKPFEANYVTLLNDYNYSNWGIKLVPFFIMTSLSVFTLAGILGLFFTYRRAKIAGQKIWSPTSKRVVGNGFLAMLAGAFFCLALMTRFSFDLILPTSLVFYGLACVNASKYTVNDILYLGICEIGLGIIGLFTTEYGIEIWAIGFGVLHIAYGILLYKKYESSPQIA